MKPPLIVTVYRGEDALALVVQNRRRVRRVSRVAVDIVRVW